jgi:stage III sporulation protein AG
MSQDKLPFKNVQTKKISQYAIFAVVGVAFLLLASFYPETKSSNIDEPREEAPLAISNVQSATDEITHDETALEKRLEEILGQVAGVGQVQARIYLSSTAQKEFAVNGSTNTRQTEEQDKNGGNRNITENTKDAQVVMTRGQGDGELPVVVKQLVLRSMV